MQPSLTENIDAQQTSSHSAEHQRTLSTTSRKVERCVDWLLLPRIRLLADIACIVWAVESDVFPAANASNLSYTSLSGGTQALRRNGSDGSKKTTYAAELTDAFPNFRQCLLFYPSQHTTLQLSDCLGMLHLGKTLNEGLDNQNFLPDDPHERR